DSVDHEGLARLVEFLIAAGADGLVFPGVASEFAQLEPDERERAFRTIARVADGRAPLVVGASAANARVAGALARSGRKSGASAAMVMAPAELGADRKALTNFFARVAEHGDLPIVMQNAPPPVGAGLPVATILEVVSAVPGVRYVKEETLPCGQRISQLIAGAPQHLGGVLGGAGGRYIIDELNRGAAGTMPACELTEVHAAIVRAHANGDSAGARGLFNRIVPLLNFQAVFRWRMTKAVLRRRGLIECEHVRAPGPELDAQDGAELQTLLDEVADLLMDTA
ncbi:MAG: dihydrodipicolinate synthase family protein, partial [Gammaproteobacteria bacterium]